MNLKSILIFSHRIHYLSDRFTSKCEKNEEHLQNHVEKEPRIDAYNNNSNFSKSFDAQ